MFAALLFINFILGFDKRNKLRNYLIYNKWGNGSIIPMIIVTINNLNAHIYNIKINGRMNEYGSCKSYP